MRSNYLRSLFLFCALIVSSMSRAQLSGTITIPNSTYPTLKSAVDALNAQGVGTGGVVINVAAGNTQTAPAGGYVLGSAVLNASVSAAKTIVINGNGNSITPFTGTGATDAFFKFSGLDYTTLDGFVMAESAANTTANAMMEYGIELLNANASAPFDGCQNNIIRNCTITLNRTSANATMCIYSAHITATSTTALTITAPGDTHSGNKIYSNSLGNCVAAIRMEGFAATAPFTLYDQNNDVGGSSTATGNTVTNMGNVSAWNLFGIMMLNQTGGNCSYNTVNPAQGSRGNNTQSIGIYSTGLDFTANNNTIRIVTATGAASFGIGINAANTGNLTTNNNIISLIDSAGSNTHYHIYSTAANAVVINNNTLKAIATGTATSGSYGFIYASAAAVTETINNNVFDSVSVNTSGTIYGIYTSNTTPAITISGNRINGGFSRSVSGTTYMIYNLASPTTGTSVVTNNNFSNVSVTGTGSTYGIYYNTAAGHSHTISGDTISNWTSTGAAQMYGIYVPNGNNNSIFNNLVSNMTSTYNGTGYGIYGGSSGTAGNLDMYNNTVSGVTNGGSPLYGMYVTTTNTGNVYNNRISNITSGTSTGATAYGMYVSGAVSLNLYNNMIADIKAPVASGTSPVYGIYLNGGTAVQAYHNTVNLTPVSTGTNFGATGLYYAAGVGSLDLRNNIIRVVAAPAGTGTVVALRRSTGTAGTAPVNLAATTNGNIYYAPTATNSYLYGESTSTTMVNGFSLTNDPAFNTACGLYKTFMLPRESSTFTENNLAQIGTTNTYAPTGTSYAESNAVPTTAPAVTTDLNGVARTAADIGALQFSGTAQADVAPPTITYTALPVTTYCTTPPTLVATITDRTGVNNTAGTAPRLYYKKSTEANAFGVANNNTGNGWKWVEGTASGAVYTFVFDYTKLTSAVAIGDSITYFVVAQDNAATPNVGSNTVGFSAGYCPVSVNIPASGGPIVAAPRPNGYKLIALPTFAASASTRTICTSGSSTVSLTPAPAAGAAIQWQQDNGSGTFTDIAGATAATYNTGTITATNRYRAQIKCGGTAIATSSPDTVTVSSPVVSGTTPASRCGIGTVTLGATGSSLRWYAAATGGSSIGSGTSFTTPVLNGTTTFYVSATSGGGVATLGKPTPVSTTGNSGFSDVGLVFDAITGFTIQSVDVYPISTSSTSGTITIALKNSAGTTLQSTTANVTVSATGALNTVPLNFAVTPGTNYRLVVTAATGMTTLIRESTAANINYPYTVPGTASITSAYTGGASPSYYYYFYNWQITSGCESARTPVVATVTPPPAIAASATPSTICLGSSTNVAVTSANANYGYVWSSSQTTASFSASPTTTTRYVVTATDAGTNCVAKDSVTVTVLSQPATVTPAATQNICVGNSVTLTANTGAGLRYQWYNGTTLLTGDTASTYTATVTGSYKVVVTSTANGCSGTSTPVTVNVYPLPTATITPNGNLSVCSGSTLTLTGPTGTSYTYLWKNGTNPAAGTNNAVTYNATTAGTYTLTVSANGCSTVSAPVTVTVLPLPVATMSPITATAGCDSVVLSSVDTGVSYQWNYNNAPIVGGNAPSYAATVTGDYSLTNTGSNGCKRTTPNVTITVNPSPIGLITYNTPLVFCEGGAVVLNTYTGANQTYEWRDTGMAIPGANGPTLIVTQSGLYSVYVANTVTGCARSSQALTVQVNPLPVPQVTYNPSANMLSTTRAYMQYQWFMNTQPVNGATQRNFTPQANGAYAVTVTDSNGCVGTSQIQFVNSVGIANTSLGRSVKVYPNPSSSMIYVEAPVRVQLVLRDVTGKIALKADEGRELDVTRLANGMYLLYISTADGQLIRAEKITKTDR